MFCRNLSFDSMEDDLKELMNERFGDIRYCKIVMDKSMQHSKGSSPEVLNVLPNLVFLPQNF